MQVKVCGLKDAAAVEAIRDLNIDCMGFIHVPSSPRKVTYSVELVDAIRRFEGKKVGVFVNAPTDVIKAKAAFFEWDTIQLHGEEPPYHVEVLRQDYTVIKAFSVDAAFDFSTTDDYQSADYFLFDAKGIHRGGNGVQFDWDVLHHYRGATPFLLSGGIGSEDAKRIRQLRHPKFMGIDINSKFEMTPGRKNRAQIASFLTTLNA